MEAIVLQKKVADYYWEWARKMLNCDNWLTSAFLTAVDPDTSQECEDWILHRVQEK